MSNLPPNRELAAKLIDLVEDAIRKEHPEIDAKAQQLEGNTLVYSERYYELEDFIANLLELRHIRLTWQHSDNSLSVEDYAIGITVKENRKDGTMKLIKIERVSNNC